MGNEQYLWLSRIVSTYTHLRTDNNAKLDTLVFSSSIEQKEVLLVH